MKATNLAIAFAMVSMITTNAAFGQAGAQGIQQPESYNAAYGQVGTQSLQQPMSFASATAAASNLQQPYPYASTPASPVSYGSFYGDVDNGDAAANGCCDVGGCGDSCGCGDGCDDGCDDGCTIWGWDVGGWIQQGITFNGYDPRDGFNGTVFTNDLANEYMLNQVWLYVDKEVDNGGCGWDCGGRVDMLTGTDAVFFQMEDGLEESWGQNGRYQFTPLRFYVDIAYNDWLLRTGRFDVRSGIEPYEATESFFYSHSYIFAVQPGTFLGMMLERELSDTLWVSAGIHRGSDQFDDTDGKNSADFLGGVTWTSCDEESWLEWWVIAEENGPANNTFHSDFSCGTMLTEDWEYMFQWYTAYSDSPGTQAEWYGINNHLYYYINDCWSTGARFEWFRDDDGFILYGFRDGNTAGGPFDGDFYELTWAFNYVPTENFAIRPEVRWDWYHPSAGGPLPFDDGTKNRQFLASIDMIWAW